MANRTCTSKDKEVYEFIRNFIIEHSYPPTLDEIAKGMNCGKTSVYEHVSHLFRNGLLETDHPGSGRAMRVSDIELIIKHQSRDM